MSVFKGAGVAIVTPMYEDETVNYDKLGEILDEQVARSTDAIIAENPDLQAFEEFGDLLAAIKGALEA